MAKKIKSVSKVFNSKDDYADLVELFELEDVADEDIARDMNVELRTVRQIKEELMEEDLKDSPSLFFKSLTQRKKPGRI